MQRLARSAPTKPVVCAAMTSRSTSGPSMSLRAWTARIARRPDLVGRSTRISRSNRPGRRSAGSSTSGRLVAADQHDAGVRVEAVHLDEQLVQRVLALVVAAAGGEARHVAALADRVELVDEHDARRLRLRRREEVAHARRADADEHLDELGAAEVEERHAGLAGDGAREQRLAGAGRADQQHALRQLGAEAGVLGGILEEGDDLLRLLDRLVDAGDVGERDARGRIGLRRPSPCSARC